MEKINRESKKFYERELKQYWENKKRLCRLLDRAEKAVYDKNTSSRTIIYLQERIQNIEITIKQLKPFEKEIFELIFKEQLDWKECKFRKNIDKNTYYNIFNKAIYLLAKEFGEIWKENYGEI